MPPGPKGKKSSKDHDSSSEDSKDGKKPKKPYNGRWRLFEFREGGKEKTDVQLGEVITE